MSKTAAAIASCCPLPAGGLPVVVAALLFLPAATLAANPDPALRRSDQIDLRRLGKVSEDERSVLRVEWRAGLAGVNEARSIADMFDQLRRLEAGIRDVSQLVRRMPTPPVAAANPVAAAMPAAAGVADADGYDMRLMAANVAALVLVALWWFRRRKPATLAETGPASMPLQEPPAEASLPPATMSVATPPAADPVTVPEAAVPSSPPSMPDPVVAATATPAAKASWPATAASAAAAVASRPSSRMPVGAPSAPAPAAPFAANETMVVDFSLEEADPETVARENAKLQTLRPASRSEPRAAAPVEHKVNVEPTLQLAEIMLSMGLEEGAAQALIEYTEANPRHAIYHWLKLLGIYRSRGLQHEFAATAEKLRRYFNIQAAEWGTPAASEVPTLENFSRVAEHVQKIWTQPEECISYLRRLLEDNREGARAGFPQSVAEEILLLVELQKDLAGPGQPAA